MGRVRYLFNSLPLMATVCSQFQKRVREQSEQGEHHFKIIKFRSQSMTHFVDFPVVVK